VLIFLHKHLLFPRLRSLTKMSCE